MSMSVRELEEDEMRQNYELVVMVIESEWE